MEEIVNFIQEVGKFLETCWNLKSFIVILIIVVVLFLAWGKIVTVINDTRTAFKGDKKE